MRAASLAFFILLFFFITPQAHGQQDCLECHQTKEKITTAQGLTRSIFVDEDALKQSPHAGVKCLECHPDSKMTSEIDLDMDLDVSKPLHKYPVEKVACGGCHKSQNFDYRKSAHGLALAANSANAPSCQYCHGAHQISKASALDSPTNRANSPYLCGQCHTKGQPAHRGQKLTEATVPKNFPEMIHGKSFFDKGLTVAATCADCHGAHLQLKHTEPDSQVSHRRILETCSRCHLKIGPIHGKILQVDLWKNKPWALPSCAVCHKTHEEKIVAQAARGVSNELCLKCHRPGGAAGHEGLEKLTGSVHSSIACASCHTGVDPKRKDRPCAKNEPVDCAHCHAAFGAEYAQSIHGAALAAGVQQAPKCATCHGKHDIQFHMDEKSPTYRSAIPALCGQCHGGQHPPSSISAMGAKAITDYSTSVHGAEVLKKGHLAPAVCTDCHSSHGMRKSSDPMSTVYKENVATTCGTCHKDIYSDYTHSAHFSLSGASAAELPTCSGCHSAHNISKVTGPKFNREINFQCGGCHKKLADTYKETIHGKIHKLGYEKAAKCSDCHEAHVILPASDPRSSVAPANLMATCGKCHKNISKNFTGFIPHADFHSMDKRP
ncbi:MAG: multiheme c-type cytochrome, partial [Nitrospinota bacterium]|nr:multiheme c-type cytochrome [Nitrospinota bacterium]